MANNNVSPTLQAWSAVRKSGMSITLPRNFAPLSLTSPSDEPRTPDQTFAELKLPPPPAHSTYRIRRPRLGMDSYQMRSNALPGLLFASDIQPPTSALRQHSDFSLPTTAFNSDEALPSIETPTTGIRPPMFRGRSEPTSANHLQVPVVCEPPRTPPAQTKVTTPTVKSGNWGLQRAASVCSVQSESSVSSAETHGTRPTSFDGSATSPDCDNQDPFSPQLVKIIPDTPTRRSKKMRINTSFDSDCGKWNIEMDNHLFNVYQMYLADPTVTPFKTVPGSIPPTGVCHRVSRRARETWPKASRIEVPIVKRYRVRNLLDIRRSTREKTPELNDFLKTDSLVGLNDGRSTWPSEGATRKRLKQLCRDKFTITAHYQRLRESRSPSPFSEQFTRRPTSQLSRSNSEDPDRPFSFATRELGISLVASDATAPLARLTGADVASMEPSSDNWFNTPLKASNAPNASEVSSLSSSIPQPDRLSPLAAKIPRLASPFNYSTWNGPGGSRHPHRRHISHGQYDTIHATGSRLLSPFRPEPEAVNMNKRRAQRSLEQELSPRGSNLSLNTAAMNLDEMDIPPFQPKIENDEELVFTGAGDISQRRIRIRNRGATLGSVVPVSGRERVERLFTPVSMAPSDVPPIPELPESAKAYSTLPHQSSMLGNLKIPELDPHQRRLGSPFELDPTKRSLRNRSPRHVPSLSDPFISTDHFGLGSNTTTSISSAANNNSIGNLNERLALFEELQKQRYEQDHTPV